MTMRGLHARSWMALALAVALSGCSLVNGPRQVVAVRSTPSGATVMVDGEPAGVTPVDVRVRRHNADPVLRIEKDGFEHVDRELDRGFSGLFIGDMLLAGFFGSAFIFGAGTGGESAGTVVGMGALGLALILGPPFAMGTPFDFATEVDVSLTPLADHRKASRNHARSMMLDSETDALDLRRLVVGGGKDPNSAWLRERVRAVRVRTDGEGVAWVGKRTKEGRR